MNKVLNQRGMSLIEAMIAGALSVGVVLVSLSLNKTMQKSQKKSENFLSQKHTNLTLRQKTYNLILSMSEATIDQDLLFSTNGETGVHTRFPAPDGSARATDVVNHAALATRHSSFALSHRKFSKDPDPARADEEGNKDVFEHLMTVCIPISKARNQVFLDDILNDNDYKRRPFVYTKNDFTVIQCCPKDNPNCKDGAVNGITEINGAGNPVPGDIKFVTRIIHVFDQNDPPDGVNGETKLKSIPAYGDLPFITGAGFYAFIPDVDPARPLPLEKLGYFYYSYNNDCVNRMVSDPSFDMESLKGKCIDATKVDITYGLKDLGTDVDIGVNNLGTDIDI